MIVEDILNALKSLSLFMLRSSCKKLSVRLSALRDNYYNLRRETK